MKEFGKKKCTVYIKADEHANLDLCHSAMDSRSKIPSSKYLHAKTGKNTAKKKTFQKLMQNSLIRMGLSAKDTLYFLTIRLSIHP